MIKLVNEIIAGRRLTGEDDLSVFLTADLGELCKGADTIRAALCGDRVDLCSIVNGRGGRCSEDCKFCAQSAHHHTGIETYPLLPKEKVIEAAKRAAAHGANSFGYVTSGYGYRRVTPEFQAILDTLDVGKIGKVALWLFDAARLPANETEDPGKIETSFSFFETGWSSKCD